MYILVSKSRFLEFRLLLRLVAPYSIYERDCPLPIAPVFKLRFFIVLESRVVRKSQTLA